MDIDELENIVRRQLRPTDRQWKGIKAMANSLGIACNGRGCVNYKLDVALACVLKSRKLEDMANNKRQPEYRLKKRWQDRGFILSGSREVINERTFTQAHARKIVAMGLAEKYLEVVESWNRSDSAVTVAASTDGVDTDVVEVTESMPVDGDGDGTDTTTAVRKSRRRGKKKATEASSTEETTTASNED